MAKDRYVTRLNNGESREAGFAKKKLAWNSFIISTKSIEWQYEVVHRTRLRYVSDM